MGPKVKVMENIKNKYLGNRKHIPNEIGRDLPSNWCVPEMSNTLYEYPTYNYNRS